jgi:hypothetical protein
VAKALYLWVFIPLGIIMGELKVYLREDLKKEFKKRSMEAFGYGRGSISKAAEEAIQRWTSEREKLLQEIPPTQESVKVLRGMLKHVRESSVELQHEARRIRAERVGT